MRKISFIILGLLSTIMVSAVPAKKGVTRVVALENGESITLTLCGDEFGHYWVAENGDRYFVNENDRVQFIDDSAKKSLDESHVSKRVSRNIKRQTRQIVKGQPQSSFKGEKKGLVILVEFSDLNMKSGSTHEEFENMFNLEGYSNNNHIGSVHDYFYDQSYGQFDLTFDVVGPVKMSQTYSYYGRNDSNGDDRHPAEMVIEACNAVDDQVDFADYDWDGDGEVEQVFLVYAGYGENAGASSNTIWPHEYDLSSAGYYGDGTGATVLDGVTIDTYAVSCELSGKSGATMNGIGTACHEFAHCLGYPDFYDVDYSGGIGMQAWDLLDSGSYNGPDYNGEIPAGFSAYERWVAGWLEPVELKLGMKVEGMKFIAEEAEAYVIFNDGNNNEYYMLENRDNNRWFSYLGSSKMTRTGMLITHVDYNKNVWDSNGVNDTKSHQRMTVIPANNITSSANTMTRYAGMLYPYEDNNSLTNTSRPAAKVFNENTDGSKYMNKPIYEITVAEDGTISFRCGNEDDSQNDSPSGSVLFYESFNLCEGIGGNDDIWSETGTGVGAFNADNTGWTSSNKYGANQCARFGSSKNIGRVTTPAFECGGEALLSFKAAPWGTDGTNLQVFVNEQIVANCTMTKEQWTNIELNIEGSGSVKVTFQPSKRFFLDEVKVTKLEATAITTLVNYNNDAIYTITGQYAGNSVSELSKGIYVKNGKKYLVK